MIVLHERTNLVQNFSSVVMLCKLKCEMPISKGYTKMFIISLLCGMETTSLISEVIFPAYTLGNT